MVVSCDAMDIIVMMIMIVVLMNNNNIFSLLMKFHNFNGNCQLGQFHPYVDLVNTTFQDLIYIHVNMYI